MDWLYLRKTALFLDVFVVFILYVSTEIQGHAPKCSVFEVRRGTVHKVCINKPFRISYDLKYCDDQTINITWTKENLKAWIPVSGSGQMSSSQNYSAPDLLTSYLTFANISKHHEGLYRCELQLSNSSANSHYINISVSDDSLEDEMSCTEMTVEKDNTERDNTDTSSDSNPWWLPYLFICMGVVIPVLILTLISILCINGSKNFRRRKTQRAQVQFTDLLKCDEFVCVQYSEKTLTTTHPALPPELCSLLVLDGVDDHLYMRDKCLSQVLYASLLHFTPAQSSAARQKGYYPSQHF